MEWLNSIFGKKLGEASFGRKHIFLEEESSYSIEEILLCFHPVNRCHVKVEVLLLLLGHYAPCALRAVRQVLPRVHCKVVKACVVFHRLLLEIFKLLELLKLSFVTSHTMVIHHHDKR